MSNNEFKTRNVALNLEQWDTITGILEGHIYKLEKKTAPGMPVQKLNKIKNQAAAIDEILLDIADQME
jgi:hypothetical protein